MATGARRNVHACQSTGCSSPGEVVRRSDQQGRHTNDHGLPAEVMSRSDRFGRHTTCPSADVVSRTDRRTWQVVGHSPSDTVARSERISRQVPSHSPPAVSSSHTHGHLSACHGPSSSSGSGYDAQSHHSRSSGSGGDTQGHQSACPNLSTGIVSKSDMEVLSSATAATRQSPSPVLANVQLLDASDDSDVEVVRIETRSVCHKNGSFENQVSMSWKWSA